jgi:hypothetical protein
MLGVARRPRGVNYIANNDMQGMFLSYLGCDGNVLWFLGIKKVQDMVKRLAVSQVTKAGGKVLRTHRSKKSMTQMMGRLKER